MYETVKEVLGKDAFWGVHPTWWGSVDSLNFEFYKNGFYWWDAKRDYAQTDETILYCIRTALAHRFSSPVWYNMWYSMGTRDINTYYTETWRNLRYGGRTHYLGYECPNEAVVLELKPEGMLESIEEMDARVRLFDGAGAVQPDCRLLLLFGYEAVSNWADIGMTMPWKPQNPRLDAVLNTANAVFSELLCDLVPSYAAENASLFVNGRGRAQYGTQEYDAVVVLYPDGMAKAAEDFVRALPKDRLVLCGGGALQEELCAAGAAGAGGHPVRSGDRLARKGDGRSRQPPRGRRPLAGRQHPLHGGGEETHQKPALSRLRLAGEADALRRLRRALDLAGRHARRLSRRDAHGGRKKRFPRR